MLNIGPTKILEKIPMAIWKDKNTIYQAPEDLRINMFYTHSILEEERA